MIRKTQVHLNTMKDMLDNIDDVELHKQQYLLCMIIDQGYTFNFIAKNDSDHVLAHSWRIDSEFRENNQFTIFDVVQLAITDCEAGEENVPSYFVSMDRRNIVEKHQLCPVELLNLKSEDALMAITELQLSQT